MTFCLWLIKILFYKDSMFHVIAKFWWKVVLIEKTSLPCKSHWPVASCWKVSVIMLSWVHLTTAGNQTHHFSGDANWDLTTLENQTHYLCGDRHWHLTVVVISIDCIHVYRGKPNYHKIVNTTYRTSLWFLYTIVFVFYILSYLCLRKYKCN